MSTFYRIHDWEIDPAIPSLRLKEEELHLRPLSFQVLLYLIKHRDRTVTKQELLDEIWSDSIVTPDTLVQCIVEIRRALADDSQNPQKIKTIPKLGYRFIGKVEELDREVFPEVRKETPRMEPDQEEKPNNNGKNGPVTPVLTASEGSKSSFRYGTVGLFIMILAAGASLFLMDSSWRKYQPEVTLQQLADKKPVVVMFFENQSHTQDLDWLREGLADMLITDLSRTNDLTVLSRQQLYVLLKRMNRDNSSPVRLEEAIEIARRSKAKVFILGRFGKFGQKIRVDVQLHDATNGRLISAERVVANDPDQILPQVDLLCFKLESHLGLNTTRDRPQSLSRVMTNNVDAYRYYSIAVEKAHALHNKEAIELFEKAISLDPDFAMAYARIGYTYAIRWNFADKGKQYLEKATRFSARLTEKDRLYITGWDAIANVDFERAIRIFKQIVDRYPMELEAYQQVGALLYGEKRFNEGMDYLQQALTVDPESPDTYNALCGCHSVLGNHDDAILMCRNYVKYAPNEPNAYDSLGIAFGWAGHYGEALEQFNKALELDPDFEIAIIHLGNTFFQTGQYQRAAHEYERYIQVAPSDFERARGHGALALLNRRAHHNAQALIEARQQYVFNPLRFENYVIVALDTGDSATINKFQGQLFNLELAVNRGIRPSRREDYYLRGYYYLKSERTEEAIGMFRETLKETPLTYNIESFEDCLADAYLELGEWEQALAEYQRILRINPNFPLVHYKMALAYERQGKEELARNAYQQFLHVWKNADPNIPEVQRAKARLAS